jgi:hypothetical protein
MKLSHEQLITFKINFLLLFVRVINGGVQGTLGATIFAKIVNGELIREMFDIITNNSIKSIIINIMEDNANTLVIQ